MPHDHHDDEEHAHDHKRRDSRPTPVYSVPPSVAHGRAHDRAHDTGRTTSVHPAAQRAEAGHVAKAPLARGAGRGKTLFIDAFSGIAGDMLVGALIDLGVPEQMLRDSLSTLPIDGYELETKFIPIAEALRLPLTPSDQMWLRTVLTEEADRLGAY